MSVNKVLVEWSREELWATLCDRILLSGQISKSRYYQSFLEQVHLAEISEGLVVLHVKNDLIQGFLLQNLKDVIVTELSILVGSPTEIQVKVNQGLVKQIQMDASPQLDDAESSSGAIGSVGSIGGIAPSEDMQSQGDYQSQALQPRSENVYQFPQQSHPFDQDPFKADAQVSPKVNPQTESGFTSKAEIPAGAIQQSKKANLGHARAKAKINPHLNFDQFVIGNSNSNVYSTALSVANNPGDRITNPLVIYGSTGLGKTHLLHAIGNHSFECETVTKVAYLSSEQFLNHFVTSIQSGSQTPLAKYADLDLLMIDDIQFIARGEETQVHLIELLSLLVQRGKQVVITCDKYPHEVRGEKNKKLHEDLLRRFEDGFVVDVEKPDQATRLEILKQKALQAAGRKDYFPMEVLNFVSERYTSNVRELEGIVLKLFAYKNMLGREISLDVARVVLGDVRRNANRKFTMNDIVEAVAEEFNVPVSNIISKSRKAEVMVARKVAMYLARALTDNSLHTIGIHFNRDYSSVQYCVRALMKILVKDPELNSKVETLRNKLRQS